jgi:branched-chain amino acid transport system substrate-binding protein
MQTGGQSIRKNIFAALMAAMMLMLAGCGFVADTESYADSAAADSRTEPLTQSGDAFGADCIRIGIINPTTGSLSGIGEGCDWTEQLVVDFVNDDGGIVVDGRTLPVKLIVYDSQSDARLATKLTEKLILEDGVDLVLARHTPETVNPVTGVCERYGTPCIVMDAPVETWLSEGTHEWTFLSHWSLEMLYKQYKALWEQAGFGPGATVGLLFPDDAVGAAGRAIFSERCRADGYFVAEPELYPPSTSDFSGAVNQFRAAGVDILAGMCAAADFASFWSQCLQSGFEPGFVTVGRAYLAQTDADAIENAAGSGSMNGLACEAWWGPAFPFRSSLTGLDPQGFFDLYRDASNREATQLMGCKYASMEVAVDALTRAGTLDKAAVRDAIAATELETIIGPISYNEEHYTLLPLCGGQWTLDEQGRLRLAVVDNSLNRDIPLTGELAAPAK